MMMYAPFAACPAKCGTFEATRCICGVLSVCIRSAGRQDTEHGGGRGAGAKEGGRAWGDRKRFQMLTVRVMIYYAG